MPSSASNGDREFRGTPGPQRESDVLRAALDGVRARLPASWSVDLLQRPEAADPGVDAELRLTAPDGVALAVLVQARRLLSTRDAQFAIEALRQADARHEAAAAVLPLVAARYLAPATRERIADLGGGYADATGNLLLAADRPALFLRDRGADRDPWRGPGRPRGSLQGAPAARVVRALTDFAPPYSVPDLARLAKTSTGATYRVVELLDEETLLTRERYGPITDVRWRPLLERWSQDHGFSRSATTAAFLEPRGLDALSRRLAEREDLDYVVTGSMAAARLAPYAPARLATLYVRDVDAVAEALELRPAETGANVVLAAAGHDDAAFERLTVLDGLRIAAPSQVAVDLLAGPGRNPSEGAALLDWMERHESDWRR